MNLLNLFRRRLFGHGEDDRRRHSRIDRVTMLTIQQLDDDLSQVGEPIWGFSRDFGEGGIGFTCQTEVKCNYLRITVSDDHYSVIGMVRHCVLIDEDQGIYFVGLQFLEDYNSHNGG